MAGHLKLIWQISDELPNVIFIPQTNRISSGITWKDYCIGGIFCGDLVSQISWFEQICEIKNPQKFLFFKKMGVPNPKGQLSSKVPLSSILSANKDVKTVLQDNVY